MSWKRRRDDRVKPRNPYVVPSRQKKSGPMTPPNIPRGGAKHWTDFLEESKKEEENDDCDDE